MAVTFSERNWFSHVIRRVILWMAVLLMKKDFKFSVKNNQFQNLKILDTYVHCYILKFIDSVAGIILYSRH